MKANVFRDERAPWNDPQAPGAQVVKDRPGQVTSDTVALVLGGHLGVDDDYPVGSRLVQGGAGELVSDAALRNGARPGCRPR